MAGDTAGDILEAQAITRVAAEELDGLPKKTEEPLLVAFVASWCEVSLEAAPGIARAFRRLDGRARAAWVDVDRAAVATERLGVRSVPAVVLFAHGRESARLEGAAAEDDLVDFCEKALDELPTKGEADGEPGQDGADDPGEGDPPGS